MFDYKKKKAKPTQKLNTSNILPFWPGTATGGPFGVVWILLQTRGHQKTAGATDVSNWRQERQTVP